MKNCETCKHWRKTERNSLGHSFGMGVCENTPMFWDATEWGEDGDTRAFIDECKNKKAFVQDGSDYMAYLLTLPDFGCVSHEARDAG